MRKCCLTTVRLFLAGRKGGASAWKTKAVSFPSVSERIEHGCGSCCLPSGVWLFRVMKELKLLHSQMQQMYMKGILG